MDKIPTMDITETEPIETKGQPVKNNKEDKNEFSFCGTIVNMYKGENIMFVTLGVTTLTGRRAYTDYPRIRVFDPALRQKIETIGLHNKVVLKGYISTNKPRPGQDQKDVPPQSFVCTDVSAAASLIEEDFAVTNRSAAMIPDQNKVIIVGQVNRAYIGRGGNINLEVISFREKKYMKRLHVTYFPPKKENPMEMMVPGTRVAITGRCRTSRKEMRDGSTRYYEGVVADAIARL